jgi:hypothetical protein
MLGYKMLILSLPDHQTINIIVNKKKTYGFVENVLLGFWNININVSFLKTVWKTLC